MSIRTCALRGAQLILVPTANTTEEDTELFQWEMRTQAVQNGVFIAMCNRVGLEGNMNFCGKSLLCDPDGKLTFLADAAEGLYFAELDPAWVNLAQKKRPYLALRRPEHYER